jgi:hypothetical protein
MALGAVDFLVRIIGQIAHSLLTNPNYGSNRNFPNADDFVVAGACKQAPHPAEGIHRM